MPTIIIRPSELADACIRWVLEDGRLPPQYADKACVEVSERGVSITWGEDEPEDAA